MLTSHTCPALLLSFKFLFIGGEKIFHCCNLPTLMHRFSNLLDFYPLSAHAVYFCIWHWNVCFLLNAIHIEYSFLISWKYCLFPFDILKSVLASSFWQLGTQSLFWKLKSRKKTCLELYNNENVKYYSQNKKTHDKLGKIFVTWCS